VEIIKLPVKQEQRNKLNLLELNIQSKSEVKQMKPVKIIIIGGVAGGASAAVRARRINENAEIIMFEKGPYISYANCGLPYYLSKDIENEGDLILQTPANFKMRFNIDVFINHEVISINRHKKTIKVKNISSSREERIFEENYDKLILAPGASAIKPPIPGIEAENVFFLKTVPDTIAIDNYIEKNNSRKAVILGGGYIGLEVADALNRRGLQVTVVERENYVMPMIDTDMVPFVERHLTQSGIKLLTRKEVMRISTDSENIGNKIQLKDGEEIEADIIIASLGVKPHSELAKAAGLELGLRDTIKVNEFMETSDPDIYAVGDVVLSYNLITGKWVWIPLAGPANKQGRVAGTNAAGGMIKFKGVLGTSIVEFNGLAVAKTGLSERDAEVEGIDYFVSKTHSPSHARYYPGGDMVHMKLIVKSKTGRIIGAQAIGKEGVDKRIDVVATAIYFNGTVDDLSSLDLAYAPQFGSPKDPVNIAGMTAQNRLNGLEKIISMDEYLKNKDKYYLLDVRSSAENRAKAIEGSHNIPINHLRERLNEIPKDKPIAVYCLVGYRGYIAQRILDQKGYEAYNLDGGFYID
jgi:NADPH-dependent 2,4-dienoyl-CoA reductase/sulfur reductase-like enzyme/rhodanese-related sulfurtransferase